MKNYRVNFMDKHSDETRSITVQAENEDDAETKACERADNEKWDDSFKVLDAEEID